MKLIFKSYSAREWGFRTRFLVAETLHRDSLRFLKQYRRHALNGYQASAAEQWGHFQKAIAMQQGLLEEIHRDWAKEVA